MGAPIESLDMGVSLVTKAGADTRDNRHSAEGAAKPRPLPDTG